MNGYTESERVPKQCKHIRKVVQRYTGNRPVNAAGNVVQMWVSHRESRVIIKEKWSARR